MLRIVFNLLLAVMLSCGAARAQQRPADAPSPGSRADRAPGNTIAPRGTVSRGRLTYYGKAFHGSRTASGEHFDAEALTMAHRTLPFGTRVRVTNLHNGRSVEVRVNDRGPVSKHRIGDVSLAAARRLGMLRSGTIDAMLEVLAPTNAGSADGARPATGARPGPVRNEPTTKERR